MDEYQALAGVSRTMRTLADGTLRLQVDFEPRDRKAAADWFGDPGTPLAIAVMKNPTDGPGGEPVIPAIPAPADTPPKQYGEAARQLHASGFFRVPDVWRAAGTDDDYLEWLKTRTCHAKSSRCDGDVVPAHFRISESGADHPGTTHKPRYRAIPLCNAHHCLQHNQGYTAVMPIDEWQRAVVFYLSEWARSRIKAQLGYEHYNQIPPQSLLQWAQQYGVERYLPPIYRGEA